MRSSDQMLISAVFRRLILRFSTYQVASSAFSFAQAFRRVYDVQPLTSLNAQPQMNRRRQQMYYRQIAVAHFA